MGVDAGLRQGWPLSPTVFNIYVMGMVDKLERSDKSE